MKKMIVCGLLITVIGSVQAQVKVGNNPNSINSNSLLELESTNKGLLTPRVSLLGLDTVAPLSGTVPAGMLVYNNGGALTHGPYTWNGSRWLSMASSESHRTNHVLVQSESDLPAPVNGVITLVSGVTYEVNGTVNMTNKLDLNDCTIVGKDRVNDKLIYTPSTGELFTGSKGGTIYSLTISATGAGAKLFNLDAQNDPEKALILEFVYVFDNHNIGLIKGFAGFVVFNNIAFANNTNGITLENLGDYIGLNEFWIAGNQNTFQKFVGTFSTILIEGGKKHALSVFSAKSIDVSGITSISVGAELTNTLFVGDGVKVVGTFGNQWEVDATGLDTEKDAVSSANLYITTAVNTTFTGSNTPTKINGTTTAVGLFRVSSPSDNRLTYLGTKSKRFQVICSLSALASGNNKNFSFYIVKNGTVMPESKQLLRFSSQVDRGSITLSCSALLATNDYIEVWVSNDSDATSVKIESLNLAIK